jgi:hypothetical protein
VPFIGGFDARYAFKGHALAAARRAQYAQAIIAESFEFRFQTKIF